MAVMIEAGRELIYLSEEDLKACQMTMKTCIDLMEELFLKKAAGLTVNPEKQGLFPRPGAWIQAMTGEICPDGGLGVKWLSCGPENRSYGLPRFTGLVVLNDLRTGAPLCVMNASYVTGIRTGAVSGLALRHLARKESRTVGVLGCGLEGRTNLEAALCELPEIREVYAWAPREASVTEYAAKMSRRFPGITVTACRSAEEAVCGADVLLASSPITSGDEFRIIEPSWCREGLTAVPVNRDMHFRREALGAFDRTYVDDARTFAARQAKGELAGLGSYEELASMIAGKAAGRQDAKERVLVLTEGLAIEDVACAKWFYENAAAEGIGRVLPL